MQVSDKNAIPATCQGPTSDSCALKVMPQVAGFCRFDQTEASTFQKCLHRAIVHVCILSFWCSYTYEPHFGHPERIEELDQFQSVFKAPLWADSVSGPDYTSRLAIMYIGSRYYRICGNVARTGSQVKSRTLLRRCQQVLSKEELRLECLWSCDQGQPFVDDTTCLMSSSWSLTPLRTLQMLWELLHG